MTGPDAFDRVDVGDFGDFDDFGDHVDVGAKRSPHNAKWSEYGPDVLPAWVAEHDSRAVLGAIIDRLTPYLQAD